MTGTHWLEESGFLDGPVALTNTNSVGIVRDEVIRYAARRWGARGYQEIWSLPVVAETWDGYLNDIYGNHVKPEHLVTALDNARPGSVEEGGVGGGNGHDLLRVQGRDRNGVATPRSGGWRLHARACWSRPTSAAAISS